MKHYIVVMRKKTFVSILAFIVFLFASIMMINTSPKSTISEYRSTDLKQVVTIDGNTTRTDFVDCEGNLCCAANLGYATKVVTREEYKEWEIYFDDQGERTNRTAGYYGILREYDEKGNNIRITYLDAENKPTTTAEGYSIEERTYNEREQQITSKYLNSFGEAVETRNYGYGKRNEYDEDGRVFRVTYVDQFDYPMSTAAGYSIIEREFYLSNGPEKGKVKKELYFDFDGKPVALSLGQYGIYREYNENGQVSLITYLDAYGDPIETNNGYATIVYTYHVDDTIATVMYFDTDGKPFRMPEGQYGVKDAGGQTVYLNANGKEQFNIKKFVYNDSRFVVLFAICTVIISVISGKKLNWMFLIIYLLAIGYFTLMYRESGEMEISVFHSFKSFLSSVDARAEIFRNVWLFIPLGAILYQLFHKKTILFFPILLSITIEAIQYFTGTGLCELDDVISNGLGGVIGYRMSSFFNLLTELLFHFRRDPTKILEEKESELLR